MDPEDALELEQQDPEQDGLETQDPPEQEPQQQAAPTFEIDYDRLAEAVTARQQPQQQYQQQPQQQDDPYAALEAHQYDAPALGKAITQLAVQEAVREIVGQLGPVINPIVQSHAETELLKDLPQEAQEYVRGLGPISGNLTPEARDVIRNAALYAAQQKSGANNLRPPSQMEAGVGRSDNFQVDAGMNNVLGLIDNLSRSLNGKAINKQEILKGAQRN